MRLLLTVIAVLVSIAYPLLVYLGIQHLSPAIFALIIAALAVIKVVAARGRGQHGMTFAEWALLVTSLVYSLALLLANNELMLKLYPVVISLCVALLFALSLRTSESLIERMARMAGETITPRAKVYTRVLTGVWTLLLLINALIAFYLALFASLKSWALYSGLLAYIFFGLFFALEYTYRRYYINKYRDETQ